MIKKFADGFNGDYTLTIAGPDGEGAIAIIIEHAPVRGDSSVKVTFLARADTIREVASTLTKAAG